jgi:Skp family chaperone for outer membrane proteins
VKRTVAFAAGALALGLAGFLGNYLRAQQAAPAAAARPANAEPRTRIALLNIAYVIKYYKKTETFQSEMKGELKTFDERIRAKNTQYEQLGKHAQDPKTTAEQREADQKQMTQLKREIEDLNAEGKSTLGKKSDEQMVILYREIQDAARRYAEAHNFEAVFTYMDATTQTDYYSPNFIARKFQNTSLMPLYQAPGMDISAEVLTALNTSFQRAHAGDANPRPAGN